MGLVAGRLKQLLLQTEPTRRLVVLRWIYDFTPAQLAFFVQCLDETAHLPGPVLEIGCFQGATTVWLNKHLESKGIRKRYIAIDTFAGFVASDIDGEVRDRGKGAERDTLAAAFRSTSRNLFDATVEYAGFTNVESHQADATTFDFSRYVDISFALLDVDLYEPTAAVLPRLYGQMANGGIIVVDDCQPDNIYDGANQAYLEFVADQAIPERVEHGKLGIIKVSRG
jgi:O-methyltransferase